MIHGMVVMCIYTWYVGYVYVWYGAHLGIERVAREGEGLEAGVAPKGPHERSDAHGADVVEAHVQQLKAHGTKAVSDHLGSPVADGVVVQVQGL